MTSFSRARGLCVYGSRCERLFLLAGLFFFCSFCSGVGLPGPFLVSSASVPWTSAFCRPCQTGARMCPCLVSDRSARQNSPERKHGTCVRDAGFPSWMRQKLGPRVVLSHMSHGIPSHLCPCRVVFPSLVSIYAFRMATCQQT